MLAFDYFSEAWSNVNDFLQILLSHRKEKIPY